jgi:hypothetical protein
MDIIKKGAYVRLRKTVLSPGERAAGIPADTAKVPLIMWISGFLEGDAPIGGEALIRTRMNRIEAGILEEHNPTTQVNYGGFVPEIMEIGIRARRILYQDGGNGDG